MAKPDKAPPKFNMVWRTLDRALSMPIFTKSEAALMQVARELSYTSSVVDGSGRAKPFRVFPSKLASRRGLCREDVSRAVATLLADGVWVGTRDRARINKNYRHWQGKHRLTDEQIRECDDALDYPVTNCGESLPFDSEDPSDASMDAELPCDETTTDDADGVSKNSQKSVSKNSQCESQGVSKNSQECEEILTLDGEKREEILTAQNAPPETPFVNRPRKTENSNTEQSRETTPLLNGPREKPFATSPYAAYPKSSGALEISTGPFEPTREQAEKNWDILWDHFGRDETAKRKLCSGYYEHQKFYSPEVWLAAIREVYRRGKTGLDHIGYFESVAADYQANGIPKREPKSGEKRLPGTPDAPTPPALEVSRAPSNSKWRKFSREAFEQQEA